MKNKQWHNITGPVIVQFIIFFEHGVLLLFFLIDKHHPQSYDSHDWLKQGSKKNIITISNQPLV